MNLFRLCNDLGGKYPLTSKVLRLKPYSTPTQLNRRRLDHLSLVNAFANEENPYKIPRAFENS